MLIALDSNLNRRRYAQNDETLYVAPADERTDYVRDITSLLSLSLIPRSHNPQWPTSIVVS